MEQAKNDKLALLQDYKLTFESSTGKRVLADLERVCYYNSTTAGNNTIDRDAIVYREGMRSVLLLIKKYASFEGEL
jgi:hypothetical protein